jgi:hypothetical protein
MYHIIHFLKEIGGKKFGIEVIYFAMLLIDGLYGKYYALQMKNLLKATSFFLLFEFDLNFVKYYNKIYYFYSKMISNRHMHYLCNMPNHIKYDNNFES